MLWAVLSSGALAEIEFTEDEQAWLREGQRIRVAVFDSHYPFIYLNDRGDYAGIVKDYLQYIEKSTDIDFIEVPILTLQEGYDGIQSGKIDLYPMTFNFQGSKLNLAYSAPYLPYHYFVFTNFDHALSLEIDPNKMDPIKLAVIKGGAIDRFLMTRDFSLDIQYFESDREALKALDSGEVEGFVGEKVSSQRIVKGLNLKNVKSFRPARELYGLRLQMATHPDSKQLQSVIDKSLKSMPYDIQNGIMAHWYDNEPYKNELSGYTYFNRTPYMFVPESAVGLEFSILQHLFESMGYEIGTLLQGDPNFNYSEKLTSDDLDFVTTQVLSNSPDETLNKDNLFYSEPYLYQEYRLVSRVGEKIDLTQGNQKTIGTVLGVDDIATVHAARQLKERFGREVDNKYLKLERGLGALEVGKVDYLLVDSRELAVFLSKVVKIPQINSTHDHKTRFFVPLRIGFRGPILRDKFNAELAVFKRSAKSRRLEKFYENAVFQAKAQSAALLTEIVAYLVSVERVQLLERVFEAFNFSDSFEAINLQIGDNPNQVRNFISTNGQLRKVDAFSRQGLISIRQPLIQGQGIEQTILGELTIYSELGNSASFNKNYIPPLSIFEGFSVIDYESIRNIYERADLHVFTLNLTEQELNWIKENPVVSIGIDPTALPYEGVENGEYIGIVADVLKDMSSKVGIQFEPVLVDSWQETVDEIEQRKIPMVSAAMENKSMFYDYVTTLPLFTDQLAVAGRSGLDYGQGLGNMGGKRIGVQRGASNTPILMDNYPEIEWIPVDSSAVGLDMLAHEKLDGYVDTTYVINYIFNQHSYRNLSIVDRLDYTVTPTFHILKNEPILTSIVTKAVRSISASQKQKIINNWASSHVVEKVDYRMVILVSGFSLIVLLVFYVSNRKLKKQIEATTKAQQEALASRNQLFDILNTSSIAAIIVQRERIVYSNNRALEQFKLSSDDSYGYFISRIYADTVDRESVYKQLESSGKVVDREMVFQRDDDTQFTALCSYYLIDYRGEPAVLFWSYDISEIKNLNKDLADATIAANIANQTKSDFLANMSHEIRTPMNAIIGMSYLALEENLNRKARNYIGKVHQSAQSLLLIINDILDISKIESGKLELEQRPFSLRETLRDIANVLGFRIAEKNVDFIFNIDRMTPRMVIGDELRLSQVLINLGSNASKFTDKGEILIGLKAHPVAEDERFYRYHFYVQDTGIGIAADKLDKLFESFQQADASTTREYGGTGLGLSISKQIIELMGGRFWVESELNVGSTFHFEIQLEVAPEDHLLHEQMQQNINLWQDMPFFVLEPSNKGVDALNTALADINIEPMVFDNYTGLMDAVRRSTSDLEPLFYLSDFALSSDPSVFQHQLRQLKDIGRVILSSANEDRVTLAKEEKIEILPRPWLPYEFIRQISGLNGDENTPSADDAIDHAELLRGLRVLLAEDNELNQELVLGLLAPFHLEVDVVENGFLAVEKAKSENYTIILMDIQMPVLGGYQATEQIRQFDKTTPIVAMTANAMVGDEEKATAVGMDDYLAKPIEVPRLMQVLVDAAQKSRGDSSASLLALQTSMPSVEHDDAQLFLVERGLQTCNQNRDLFLRLIDKYLANSSSRVEDFIAAHDGGDWEVAMREIHTLKGTSASIGAMLLNQLCVHYEQHLHSENKELTSLQIARLRSLTQETQQAIQTYLDNSQRAEIKGSENEQAIVQPDGNKKSNQELVPALKELKNLLEDYDIQALEGLQALRVQSLQPELSALLDTIEGALSNYQFDEALHAMNTWLEHNENN